MDELFNSKLVERVPELVAIIVVLVIVLRGIRTLVDRMTEGQKESSAALLSAITTLEDRHEVNEEKLAQTTAKLIEDSHKFHQKLTESTHKVITENTVQLARNQDVLVRVLEKLG